MTNPCSRKSNGMTKHVPSPPLAGYALGSLGLHVRTCMPGATYIYMLPSMPGATCTYMHVIPTLHAWGYMYVHARHTYLSSCHAWGYMYMHIIPILMPGATCTCTSYLSSCLGLHVHARHTYPHAWGYMYMHVIPILMPGATCTCTSYLSSCLGLHVHACHTYPHAWGYMYMHVSQDDTHKQRTKLKLLLISKIYSASLGGGGGGGGDSLFCMNPCLSSMPGPTCMSYRPPCLGLHTYMYVCIHACHTVLHAWAYIRTCTYVYMHVIPSSMPGATYVHACHTLTIPSSMSGATYVHVRTCMSYLDYLVLHA